MPKLRSVRSDISLHFNGSLDQAGGDKLKSFLLSESESREAIQLTLSSVLYTILHSGIVDSYGLIHDLTFS